MDRLWEVSGTREVPEWEHKVMERWGPMMKPRDPAAPLPTFADLDDLHEDDRLHPGLKEQVFIMMFEDGTMVGAVGWVKRGWKPSRLVELKWVTRD